MDNEVRGVWSKGAWEGGCNNCYQKREHIAVIEIATMKLRFCWPCLESVAAIAQSLFEERDDEQGDGRESSDLQSD